VAQRTSSEDHSKIGLMFFILFWFLFDKTLSLTLNKMERSGSDYMPETKEAQYDRGMEQLEEGPNMISEFPPK
jgi:hypothetical protein